MIEHTLITFYGGTFDPIHYGHLKSVMALAHLINLQHVILLPNNIPPHRSQPVASPEQRLAIVRLAIAEMPVGLFTIDERELRRKTPSWTVDTFKTLRCEYGPTVPLGFIIGQDSLLTLSQWYRSWELLNLCHLLVCVRSYYDNQITSKYCYRWLADRITNNYEALHQQPAGLIYLAATPTLAISSSDIRLRYSKGKPCNELLPLSVQNYIDEHCLYR